MKIADDLDSYRVTRAACYNYVVNGSLKKTCYLGASVRKLIKKYKKPVTKTWLSEDARAVVI